MAVKNAVSKAWSLVRSSDGKKWSAYPAGDKPPPGPSLGAHNSRADEDNAAGNPDPATVVLAGTIAGSVRIIFDAGEFARMATPTDNLGSTVTKLGGDQGYFVTDWPGFGCRAYYVASASGGGSYTVSVDKDNAFPLEEITVAVLEVINGTTVTATSGNADRPGAGVSYSSPSITVSGPAVIFAFWTGDGATATNPKDVAVSGTGWSLVEWSFKDNKPYVQFAIAVRTVTAAGTYSCTWTPTANQGAAMKMVAVQ